MPLNGSTNVSESSTAGGETKGMTWMATSALLYALSAMIATVVNVANLAVTASRAGVAGAFAAFSFTALLGAVGWIMTLPALVLLALGLYELGRAPAALRADVRRAWLFFGAGIALFMVTIPLVLLVGMSRTFNPGLVLLQDGVGLASALLLLYAAALPALRRSPASWGAPARAGLVLGIAGAVVEGIAAIASTVPVDLPLTAAWPPVAWGFPASVVVLASSFLLYWAYASLVKTAKNPAASAAQRGLTEGP